jgi:hypothetical protein
VFYANIDVFRKRLAPHHFVNPAGNEGDVLLLVHDSKQILLFNWHAATPDAAEESAPSEARLCAFLTKHESKRNKE